MGRDAAQEGLTGTRLDGARRGHASATAPSRSRVHAVSAAEAEPPVTAPPSPWRMVPTLGLMQILAWASSYYLPAVIAKPVAESMGWPLSWAVGGVSLGLLASGLVASRVGRAIDRRALRLTRRD